MNADLFYGHIVDVCGQRIFDGRIILKDGKISEIKECAVPDDSPYIMPGFVDAHVHVESSMVLPANFAATAVKHGTVAAVCDPHEIANVLGMDGVRFMIQNAAGNPFHFWFGAPSCVPCTNMETAGAELGPKEIGELMQMPDIHYLSEMMFAYGVVIEVPEVMEKLRLAREAGKPIDGHAPGFTGEFLQKYVAAGVSTDHECTDIAEAREKVAAGMKILIREGSAAKNYEALKPLLGEAPASVMFCSDDKHPEDLQKGHVNLLVKRALKDGYPFWTVLRAATLNPVEHYSIDCGLLREGDSADFILVDNLEDMNVLATYLRGQDALDTVKPCELPLQDAPNNFKAGKITAADVCAPYDGQKTVQVIKAIDKELVTGKLEIEPLVKDGAVQSDPSRDMLKIVVYNRYSAAKPAVGFISGFGLKKGAIASSVAHDSHNLVAVGISDDEIAAAINRLVDLQGGLVAVENGSVIAELPLPVAGLMTCGTVEAAAEGHSLVQKAASDLGCSLGSPFMTLAFMCLPVIPELKITDRGLVSMN